MAEVVIALDTPSTDEAWRLVERLGGRAAFYKVGLELYGRGGPELARALVGAGKRVFLDLKLHDIPNTVAGAVRAAADLGVSLLTVHASGGARMMRAAVDAAREGAAGPSGDAASAPDDERLRLLAVTVLTSLSAPELGQAWGREPPDVAREVLRLARDAAEAGVDGVVASPLEAAAVRAEVPGDFLIVTPGIRPAGADAHDQRRIATPADAVRAGATHLVLGRAVTRAPDPRAALEAVLAEVRESAAHTDVRG